MNEVNAPVQSGCSVNKRRKLLKRIKKFIPIYIMMLPGLIYLLFNNLLPLPGLIVAFKKYNVRYGIYGSPWCGLQNFKYLFANDAFYITRNTILYNAAFIIINTTLSIAIAIILSEMGGRLKKLYQSAILLPYLLSTVILSYLVYAFLSTEQGLINRIIESFGGEAIAWYSTAKYWPFILIFVNAWKNVGYTCIVYLATIMGFDRTLYEAAAIDGASKWQQIRSITIPMLRNMVIMMTLLNIGRIMYSDFGLFYQVPKNSGALFSVTNTIDTYVYRGLLENNSIDTSAAAGFYQSIVGFVLVLGSNLIVRRKDPDSALF
ncbi:MAG: ABC transporter permease subunit [Lachnospiraceae bacterium]|nr:ABC transporter permease subunit [Lachnospiraceae bacterium]